MTKIESSCLKKMQNPNGEHNFYDSLRRQQKELELINGIGNRGGLNMYSAGGGGEGHDPITEGGHPQDCNFVDNSGSFSEQGTQVIIITGSRMRYYAQPPAAEDDWYSYQLSRTRGGWSHMPVEHDITNWQSSPKHQPIDFYAKAFDFIAGAAIDWGMARFALNPHALAAIGAAGVAGTLLSTFYDFAKASDGSVRNIGDIAMP